MEGRRGGPTKLARRRAFGSPRRATASAGLPELGERRAIARPHRPAPASPAHHLHPAAQRHGPASRSPAAIRDAHDGLRAEPGLAGTCLLPRGAAHPSGRPSRGGGQVAKGNEGDEDGGSPKPGGLPLRRSCGDLRWNPSPAATAEDFDCPSLSELGQSGGRRRPAGRAKGSPTGQLRRPSSASFHPPGAGPHRSRRRRSGAA